MPTSNEFENRRRERRRRERLRKKRIRAAVILIALLAVIVLICVAVSTCARNSAEPVDNIDAPDTQTTVIPTVAPVSAGTSIPPASEKNDLLEILRASGQTKCVYLTFDDGPTNITAKVLDVLRRYDVKATFFEVGSLIEANPDMARRVYEEGHLIANHSDGHNYEKLYASTDSFINEINKCYETIKAVGDGEEPFKLVRFPGGSYNSSADSYAPVKQECKTALAANGFYQCDWNALTGDAEGKKKNAQELLDYMKRNLDGEDNVVVLMHDAATKQATVDALPSVIEYFASEGYTFHRLDDITYQQSATTPAATTDDNTVADASASPEQSAAPAQTPENSAAPRPTSNSTGAIVIQ